MKKKTLLMLLQAGFIAATASLLTLAIVGFPVSDRSTVPPKGAQPEAVLSAPLSVADVVESVSPAVVTVGAVKRQIVRQPFIDEFFLLPSFRLLERRSRIPYLGSGFLIDEDGHILTNYHVVEDAESLFVTFPDGREFPATLRERDLYADMALLRVEAAAAELPRPLRFADSSKLRLGAEVVALGNPFGNLIEDAQPTVTRGVVSATNRNFRPNISTRRVYQGMIQTDAAINPGNSGGPLVDLTGAVVGMNTFIFSPTGASAGIGFAIPANRLQSFYEEVIEHGRLRPLALDLAYRAVRVGERPGIQVIELQPGGPAERAGLRRGDVILTADGRPVASAQDFYLLFASKQVGSVVELRVWREGVESTVRYTIEEFRG